MKSKDIFLKLVDIEDAEFILKLRTNSNLSKYLSPTDGSLENQKKWLIKYKEKEKNKMEFYFVVYNNKKEKVGVVRLYNINYEKKELTFGSFIMAEIHPKYAAFETMILMMEYSFNYLEMEKVLLDVRIKNEHAKKFYKRFGFKFIYENDLDEFYELTRVDYLILKEQKYKNFVEE